MKAIVVTDQAAGTAGMTLVERPEPPAAINDVVVQIHASGFVSTELEWPSTWADRAERNRTPSIPGHELAGVVSASDLMAGERKGERESLAERDWYARPLEYPLPAKYSLSPFRPFKGRLFDHTF